MSKVEATVPEREENVKVDEASTLFVSGNFARMENFGPVVDKFHTQLEVEKVPPLFLSKDKIEKPLFFKKNGNEGRLTSCNIAGRNTGKI